MTRQAFAARMKELAEAETPNDAVTVNVDSETTPETETSEAGGDPKEKPSLKTLDDLAERLGVEVKDLYSVEFTTAKGETRTLGAFKDLLAQHEEYTARELALEEKRVAQENELLRAKQDIEAILGAIPKESLPRDIVERARAEREKAVKRERERTLEVIPEWSDVDRETADRAEIVEHLSGYGYTQADLDQIVDHRMWKYALDNAKRWKRLSKALEALKPDRKVPNGQKPSARSTPASRRKNAVSTGGSLPPSELRKVLGIKR